MKNSLGSFGWQYNCHFYSLGNFHCHQNSSNWCGNGNCSTEICIVNHVTINFVPILCLVQVHPCLTRFNWVFNSKFASEIKIQNLLQNGQNFRFWHETCLILFWSFSWRSSGLVWKSAITPARKMPKQNIKRDFASDSFRLELVRTFSPRINPKKNYILKPNMCWTWLNLIPWNLKKSMFPINRQEISLKWSHQWIPILCSLKELWLELTWFTRKILQITLWTKMAGLTMATWPMR